MNKNFREGVYRGETMGELRKKIDGLLSEEDAEFICERWKGFQNFVTNGETSYEISLSKRLGKIFFLKEAEHMILEITYPLVINKDGIKISNRYPPTMHSEK